MARFHSLKLCSLAVSMLIANAAGAADLRVDVRGMASANGQCMIALFDKAQDFPRKPLQGKMEAASLSGATFVFSGLAEGDYAVSAFHDENGNGKLDANLVGLPIERYGFSRDAAGIMGPPSFDDAKLSLGAGAQTIVITLR